ncbi:MAG: MarC family protein [Gemmatimonadaceae bacterium]
MTLAAATLTLFLVMDPLGNIPFFLASLQQVPAHRHHTVVVRELLIAFGIMIAFLFAGGPLLSLLAISESALRVAGGVILFLIAIRMVFPPASGSAHEDIRGEPFIVPLAIPYVAGPSVLATEMLIMKGDSSRWPEWLAALTLAWLATAIILIAGSRLRSVLGPRAMIAIERLMGMILVAVSVQMFLSGLERYVR